MADEDRDYALLQEIRRDSKRDYAILAFQADQERGRLTQNPKAVMGDETSYRQLYTKISPEAARDGAFVQLEQLAQAEKDAGGATPRTDRLVSQLVQQSADRLDTHLSFAKTPQTLALLAYQAEVARLAVPGQQPEAGVTATGADRSRQFNEHYSRIGYEAALADARAKIAGLRAAAPAATVPAPSRQELSELDAIRGLGTQTTLGLASALRPTALDAIRGLGTHHVPSEFTADYPVGTGLGLTSAVDLTQLHPGKVFVNHFEHATGDLQLATRGDAWVNFSDAANAPDNARTIRVTGGGQMTVVLPEDELARATITTAQTTAGPVTRIAVDGKQLEVQGKLTVAVKDKDQRVTHVAPAAVLAAATAPPTTAVAYAPAAYDGRPPAVPGTGQPVGRDSSR